MRLLNVDTLQFRDFHSDEIPPYLVTSRRWSNDEATYKDVLKRRNTSSVGYRKITRFCAFSGQLRPKHSNKWIWIDTCCINQNSSAEVSESINSMWTWYTQSTHCIAYLRDVRPLRAGWDAVLFDFRNSDWFTRGWTLQELLGPPCVIFLTQEWEVIGRKCLVDHQCPISSDILNSKIAEVTGIPEDVLCTFESRRHVLSNDVKMAWAANRRTTKVEDAAYCLLGIFDVHMPLIYGEGERNARKRLEQEIVKREQEQDDLSNQFATPAPLSRWATRPQPQIPYANRQERKDAVKPTSSRFSSRSREARVVSKEHLCPICKLLLLEPVSTSCNHTFCESCIITSEKENTLLAPLDSEGKAEGEAAIKNFRAMLKCPICNTVDMDALVALPNTSLAQELRTRYPSPYIERAAQFNQTGDPHSQILTIFIGNWHREPRKDHHYWTFYVKPSRTDIIQSVHLHLHETFPQPHVVCPRPPYLFEGQGWGFFTIDVLVLLQPGYAWDSVNAQDGMDGAPKAALRMDWTLDFESYGGRGAMGKCRVKVKKVMGAVAA